MHLRFTLFGFPVLVQPFFLVTAWLIGPRGDVTGTVLWIASVFLGVLAHELGHAFAGRRFGLDPVIQLHGFGGLTAWRSNKELGHGRRILLSAAGPAVGIVIGVITLILAPQLFPEPGITATRLIHYTVLVNLGWGVLNLVPVLPLDGGHIAASIAEAAFGRRGRIVSVVLSLVLTGALGLWAIWRGEIWLTILAVILSISNAQALGSWGKRKRPAPTERPVSASPDAGRAYEMARTVLLAGRPEEALEWLEAAVRSGFGDGALLDADPTWASVRDEPRFAAIRRSLNT